MSSAGRLVRRVLADRGVRVEAVPTPLVRRPEAELTVSFEHAAALLSLETVRPLYFVQIGAFDGATGDPIRPFVDRCGWQGLLVEPQPRYFAALQESYSGYEGLTFLPVAIARTRESRPLYTIDGARPGLPDWAPRLASFNLETLLSHRDEIPDIESLVTSQEVECIPLGDVLAESGHTKIDVLCIDTEGYDAEVVAMLDLERYRPRIIRYEHVHLTRTDQDATLTRLMDAGYKVAVERFDTLAVDARAPHAGGSDG